MIKLFLALFLTVSMNAFSCEKCKEDIQKLQYQVDWLLNVNYYNIQWEIEEIYYMKGVLGAYQMSLNAIEKNHPKD